MSLSHITLMLQSITIPTKNFFLSPSLPAPAYSPYQFLYTTCKTPIPFSSYATGTLLSYNPPVSEPMASTSLNCHASQPSSSMMLNCRTAQTMDDMPSSYYRHLRHLGLLRILSYWTDDMPSGHLGHLRHLGHLGHLSYLSTISNLDILNLYSLDTAPTDSQPKAFITALDPKDPGLSKGYYADNLLNPIPIATPLLPTDSPSPEGTHTFLLGLLPPSSPFNDGFPCLCYSQAIPPVFSLPNKKLKLTPPSPPIPGTDHPPTSVVEEADAPSVFDILNIFCHRWFLNRDHLITNILSAQKDEHSKISWVDFQPMFHTHLVWRAITLLPALCPIAKGKHCMFMFILKVLDGDRPGLTALGPSSPSRRSLSSLVVLSTSLVPLAPLIPLALPFPLSLRRR
jgi:hypothetical protein